MDIVKPIFIIGVARSGTTLLYNLVATHPELCWFSHLTDNHSEIKQLPILHRVLDVPIIGDRMKRRVIDGERFWLTPSEGVHIYREYCGFEHARKTTEDDLTAEMEESFKDIVTSHLRLTGRSRFVTKRPGNNQRIRVINKMFPDAYYVHIIRDGRAVASSLLSVGWWRDVDVWWFGQKAGKWEEMGKDPVELWALHWQRDIEEIRQNKHLFEDRYLELRYEDLVQDTRGTVGKITRFCGLNQTSFVSNDASLAFSESLPESLPNMNYKWEERFDGAQKLILRETIGGV